jgi:hypothetical protein
MAALENFLLTVGGKTQSLNIHTPLPGDFPLADVHISDANFSKRPTAVIRVLPNRSKYKFEL